MPPVAACAGMSRDPETRWWWPPEERETPLQRIEREVKAIRVCQRCDAIASCAATIPHHVAESAAGFVIAGRAWSYDDLVKVRNRIGRVA